MKILVTGGAGYIGSHVVLELCDSGFEVIVLDDLSLGFRKNVDQRAELLIGSTLNKKDLDDVFFQNIDAVVHLAAWKAAGESMLVPGKYATANISGTINILNNMVDNNIQNFIFSSTAAVYGIPEYLPVDEDHPLKPSNFFVFASNSKPRKVAVNSARNLHPADFRNFRPKFGPEISVRSKK